MKRFISILTLMVMALTLLVGCGPNIPSSSEGDVQPDLTAFFDSLETTYRWGEDYFMDLDDETFAATYPGIDQYEFVQKVAKMPMMTSVVSEFVFLECKSAEDTAAVAEILKTRVNAQKDGGAWYPESMAAWGEARVLIANQYVALIADGENQDNIEHAWNKLFGK